MNRNINVAPCIKVSAGDWLNTNDVREWKANESSVATWGRGPQDSAYGDVFTVYDHGEGPDKDDMPSWLWDRIEKIAKKLGHDYCIVWLEDIEPDD